MDILNFISWIKSGRRVTTLSKKTLLPIAVKDGRRDDKFLTGYITTTDFIQQLGNSQQTAGTSIWTNGFRIVGCINEDITLPDNANIEFTGPLAMCLGKTLTIPAGTTLTIV